MDSNFIFILFPTGEKSAARMAVFRDVVDGNIPNAHFIDRDFWDLSMDKKIKSISVLMESGKDNFVIFVPGYKAPKFMPENLILEIYRMNEPPSAVLWYMVDSIDRQAILRKISSSEYISYGDFFDAIYTYDLYDAKKFHIPFLSRTCVDLKVENHAEKPRVFFLGRDKGRLDFLINIYEHLNNNGIECDFLILKEEKHRQMENVQGINFIEYMKYDDMIKRMSGSTCILSIAAEDNHMLPLSYEESIIYNKKLITNCDFLTELPLYDPKYQKRFTDVNDIDIDWLKEGNESINYNYENGFSLIHFMEKIEEDYSTGLLFSLVRKNRQRFFADDETFFLDCHFSKVGWLHMIKEGQVVYFDNQIEAIRITGPVKMNGIHLSVIQDSSEKQGEYIGDHIIQAGVTGKSHPISAVKIWTDADKPDVKIRYRVFLRDIGWTAYCSMNEWCGGGCNVVTGLQVFIEDISLDANRNTDNLKG